MSKTADKIINTNTAGTPVIDMTNLGNHVACPNCINKDQRIADLEAKLAEQYAEVEKVEQHYLKQREYYTKEFNEIIDNLKQQLTDTEAQNKRVLEKLELIVSDNQDLQKQLAKKDKEIETMKKDSDKNIDYLVEFASLIENEKDCNRMLKALDRVKSGNKYLIDKDHNQDKIELLEKVKEEAKHYGYEFSKAMHEYINTLISEIKGE